MVLSADSWDDSQGMTRAETPGVGLFHVINQNSVSWSQQKMCKYKSLTKVHIIHWSSCQLASQCIGQVKITSSPRDRECDMWHVQHVTPPHGPTCISPKHNWETEFLTLPRQAIFNTWSQGADDDPVILCCPTSAIMTVKWKWEIATQHCFILSASRPSKISYQVQCAMFLFA